MSLPIAHAGAGYLVHRATRRVSPAERSVIAAWQRVALFMIIGNLPDLDFVVGFVLGRPGMLHRGVSHSVLAAFVFGVVAGALATWRGRERFGSAAFAFGMAYGSHLLLDWLTIDTRPPAGGQFLWPFSDAYYIAPFPIFGEIFIDGRTRAGFLSTVFAWPSLVVLAREIVIVGIVVALWHVVDAVRFRAPTDEPATLVGEDLA